MTGKVGNDVIIGSEAIVVDVALQDGVKCPTRCDRYPKTSRCVELIAKATNMTTPKSSYISNPVPVILKAAKAILVIHSYFHGSSARHWLD